MDTRLKEDRQKLGAATEQAGNPGSPLDAMVEELEAKKAKTVREMGGPKRIEKQHELGKWTARERIARLFDAETFVEMGVLAHHQEQSGDMAGRSTPADGVVTGYGKVNGRMACVAAYDFTVMAGSMGRVGEKKVSRMREWALKNRSPLIWLIDSAGARIQEAASSRFAETGDIFFEEVRMSGVVPLVCAMMGPGAAGTAYVPALADFVPMVKGTSFMALGGPPLVKAAIGEDVTEEELGGSKVHCEVSGVGDVEVPDDAACIDTIRDYLSYFPQHNQERPPVLTTADPFDRRCERLTQLVPVEINKAYDMRKVIAEIVDDSRFFEIKPRWARNMVTGFARVAGRSIGIVANQPMWMGGAIDVNASDKAARFIQLCDAFNIPLLYLVDTPGFMIGSAVEKQGIIRHGAKFLYATADATVPKFTVVVRKAFGAGYYVMNGRAYEPDLLVAWPNAQVSLMGAQGAVNIIFRKEIAKADDPVLRRQELVAEYQSKIGTELVASAALIDDVINPADTRRVLALALERCENKQLERPWKKHGVLPV
ncbi:acyl-CoA carboxylase subunit beta [Alicyclobacillus tolerans]|uniref:acyl-CoA carboxylase subunit beta n=1 Tax=Alicyclobacillus tolerans TaxID=90970 RepID=UPI001F416B4B|nr:acyl-CoA carboxylase subunit beta [Alicyclobacillus tolerans]MCF8563252.1 acyl-CoA carboxylase subunit beta [Alicyclobacillus tolerans]